MMKALSVRSVSVSAVTLLALGLGAVQAAELGPLSDQQLDRLTAGATARNIFSAQGTNSAGGSSSSSVSSNGSVNQQQQTNGGPVVVQQVNNCPNCTATLNNGTATVTNPPPAVVRPPRFSFLSLIFGGQN